MAHPGSLRPRSRRASRLQPTSSPSDDRSNNSSRRAGPAPWKAAFDRMALELVLLAVCDSGGWVCAVEHQRWRMSPLCCIRPHKTIHGSIPSGAAESQPTATHVEVGDERRFHRTAWRSSPPGAGVVPPQRRYSACAVQSRGSGHRDRLRPAGRCRAPAVVVLNNETGNPHDTVSNESGFYRVSGLAPGRYKVTASISGFKESVVDNVQRRR